MSEIVTRSTKGLPLTHAEMDANFNNLNNDKLEADALLPYPTTVEMDAAIAAAIGSGGGGSDDPIFNSIQLSGGVGDQGKMSWNSTEETVDLIQNGSTLQLGQEQHYHCRNETGVTIPNGTLVYAAGTHGASGTILIAPYIANDTISTKLILGVTTYPIANNDFGKVTEFGKVRGLNTTGSAAGSILYPSATVAGALTTTVPTSLVQRLPIAFVINEHATNGTIAVRVTIAPDVVYGTSAGQIPTADQIPGLGNTPAGAVMYFALWSAPPGWFKANGALVSRTTYSALFAAISTTFGIGDGSTTFALPDLRAEFIRGLDDGRGVDTGRVLGSAQTDQNKQDNARSFGGYTGSMLAAQEDNGNMLRSDGGGFRPQTVGGSEARPRNIALLACIKY